MPIDPSAPPSRLQAIVEDCGLRHLVTDHSRAARAMDLAASSATLECIIAPDSDAVGEGTRVVSWGEVETAKDSESQIRVTEDDLAYIMYTSGSTGVPKGLMHTHRNGSSYAHMSARTYGVTCDDRLGNHSALHFDMSTFEYLTGPLCGATTVIIPEETTLFPVSLSELIERYDAGSLRWVLFGGEPFPPKYLWRLMELWPQARFSNSSGPAEVNQCTFYHVPQEDMGSQEPFPIALLWPSS